MIISNSAYNAVAPLAVKSRHPHSVGAAGARILAKRLRSAKVLPTEQVPAGTVSLGSTVQLYELGCRTRYTCRIVLPAEANPQHGRLSVLSSVGSTVLGASEGEVILCHAADRVLLFRIDKASHPPEADGSRP